MTPKDEVRAALMALKEAVTSPEPWTALRRRIAGATCDHALEQLDRLTVARPRKVEAPVDGSDQAALPEGASEEL